MEDARTAGDPIEIGNGLLALGFLVKWVRSDTAASPFERAHELAVEALEHFRLAGNAHGQIRALEAYSQLADRPVREAMLAEAASLAETTGDENDLAFVLAAQARHLAISQPESAAEINHRVAETYRRLGNLPGLARCLFGLAIGPGTDSEKRGYALEAADIYRSLSMFDDAARMTQVAVMNGDDLGPSEREAVVRAGLQDALRAENESLQEMQYVELAKCLQAQGRNEEAKQMRERAAALRAPSESPEHDEWEEMVVGAKMLLDLAEKRGEEEAIALYRDELQSLLDNPPGPTAIE